MKIFFTFLSICILSIQSSTSQKLTEFKTLKFPGNAILVSAQITPDNSMVLCGMDDGTIYGINILTGKVTYTLNRHTDDVYAISFSKNGKYFVSGSLDKTIIVWKIADGKLLKKNSRTQRICLGSCLQSGLQICYFRKHR